LPLKLVPKALDISLVACYTLIRNEEHVGAASPHHHREGVRRCTAR